MPKISLKVVLHFLRDVSCVGLCLLKVEVVHDAEAGALGTSEVIAGLDSGEVIVAA